MNIQNIFNSINGMLVEMLNVIPKLIGALMVLLIGVLLAKVVLVAVKNLLEKIGIDKITQQLNSIDILAKNNIEVKLSTILGKICYYIIILIFVMAAIGILDMPILAELVQKLILFIPNLIAAFGILILGLLFAETLRKAVYGTCKSLGMPSAGILASFVFYFIFVNVVIVALSQAKINADFFAQNISILIGGAVLAFSIGYGFASKDLVASFLASYYTKDKIAVGQTITINGTTGVITQIDKSSITLSTEKKNIIIPLNHILQNNIEIHL